TRYIIFLYHLLVSVVLGLLCLHKLPTVRIAGVAKQDGFFAFTGQYRVLAQAAFSAVPFFFTIGARRYFAHTKCLLIEDVG
ncbi:MAG: hypothetical protein PVF74_13865, partial [Anaerolineales bacterium]